MVLGEGFVALMPGPWQGVFLRPRRAGGTPAFHGLVTEHTHEVTTIHVLLPMAPFALALALEAGAIMPQEGMGASLAS